MTPSSAEAHPDTLKRVGKAAGGPLMPTLARTTLQPARSWAQGAAARRRTSPVCANFELGGINHCVDTGRTEGITQRPVPAQAQPVSHAAPRRPTPSRADARAAPAPGASRPRATRAASRRARPRAHPSHAPLRGRLTAPPSRRWPTGTPPHQSNTADDSQRTTTRGRNRPFRQQPRNNPLPGCFSSGHPRRSHRRPARTLGGA
jgi:hypothetical protein